MKTICECLNKVVNDEQVFDFAIEHVCEKDTDDIHSVAHFIVTLYIIGQFEKQGKLEFSEEDIAAEYSKLIADRVLVNLSKKGLVDVDFNDGEVTYYLTQKGKEVAKHDNDDI